VFDLFASTGIASVAPNHDGGEHLSDSEQKPGVLSSAEKAKIDAWLKEKWQGQALCPVSKDVKWLIADHLVQPLSIIAGGLAIGGGGYPQAMVICATCGFTMYFNAVLIGLMPTTDEGQ